MNTQPFVVLPSHVPRNEKLTIRTSTDAFPENTYLITDELGKTIRKGLISKGLKEFCLSMVGMAEGVYVLKVGQDHQKFEIISY